MRYMYSFTVVHRTAPEILTECHIALVRRAMSHFADLVRTAKSYDSKSRLCTTANQGCCTTAKSYVSKSRLYARPQTRGAVRPQNRQVHVTGAGQCTCISMEYTLSVHSGKLLIVGSKRSKNVYAVPKMYACMHSK